jgi:hypothetical protein
LLDAAWFVFLLRKNSIRFSPMLTAAMTEVTAIPAFAPELRPSPFKFSVDTPLDPVSLVDPDPLFETASAFTRGTPPTPVLFSQEKLVAEDLNVMSAH